MIKYFIFLTIFFCFLTERNSVTSRCVDTRREGTTQDLLVINETNSKGEILVEECPSNKKCYIKNDSNV